ncbi:MAG: oligoribonuclease [Gammaproteobacteria bacterium]|nr:oligoribonuclease [Gammaproteobacteria bacterium]
MSQAQPKTKNSSKVETEKLLVWIDLEMTGLDTVNDTIIEIATIVTDCNLVELAQGPVVAISQPPKVFETMDEWNQKHHNGSGLVQRCLHSQDNMSSAEQSTLKFLRSYLEAGESPMCGNSICQDRRFLAKHMPELESFFHYKNLDVSTIGELFKKWYPGYTPVFKKARKHLALSDIRESISELAFYRKHIFRDAGSRQTI